MSNAKPPITENQKIMLRLYLEHVSEQSHPDLTEIDYENHRVRFTFEGTIVMKYLP